jgi:hypothetical protein
MIEKHCLREVAFGFSVDEYMAAFADVPKIAKNPYYLAHISFLKWIAEHLEAMDLPLEPVDFIFDNRNIEEPAINNAWYFARDHSTRRDLFDTVFATAPIFRDSKKVVALQAADLLAGAVRRTTVRGFKGLPQEVFPGKTRDIPGATGIFPNEELWRIADLIKASLAGEATS